MEHIASEIERYGLSFVFVNALLAEGGLPLPLFPILLTAGALATGVGKSSLLFAKLFPGLSTASVAMAGAARMPILAFLRLGGLRSSKL